jgi:hypothetical protein
MRSRRVGRTNEKFTNGKNIGRLDGLSRPFLYGIKIELPTAGRSPWG